MAELNFVPHPIARNLATNRTRSIGVVLNDVGGDFFAPLLEGILSTTEAEKYNLLIFTSRQTSATNLPTLAPLYTDGLLVFWDSLDEENLRRLHAAGHPVVMIHQTPPKDLEIPLVTIENKAASFRIVSHLIEEHQRRRIVFLRGPDGNEDSQWRETGYREALAAHGIPVDESLVSTGEFDRYVSQTNLLKLIRSGVQFDAVFTGDDDAAIGALQALKEAGYQVPGQVSVVGFDDQRLAPFLTPPLTTIHAPTERVGAAAAVNLIRLIQNESVEPVVLLPSELVIRKSCGCS